MVDEVVINKVKFALSDKNYIKDEFSKYQILLANTFNSNMKHFNGWQTRFNGKSKKTAPYTVDVHGNIYEHYNPRYHSKYLGIKGVDEIIIPVLLENEGWLTKDVENNGYIDMVGNIYNREGDVVDKKWRGFQYWAPYTQKQLEATINLVKYLCEEFEITNESVSHNTRIEDAESFFGVVYKSNYNSYYTDLTPAWDYAEFKNKLEIK